MTAAKRQECQPEGAPQPISHDCEAVRRGDLLFISGFGSARPSSTLIGVRALARPGFKVEFEAVVGLRGR